MAQANQRELMLAGHTYQVKNNLARLRVHIKPHPGTLIDLSTLKVGRDYGQQLEL